ncbi:hypothetical protein ACFZAD_24660 [Streptomyces iakyrus]|uniref:hypothetical protein n=1 Tax=Streptomyces iakyrus TaxID=68219 RepID=UPI0036E5CBC1
MAKVNQPTAQPTAKVAAAGIGGSISIVLVWVLSQVGIDMPAEVASAVTAIVSFLSGYFVRERA